MHLSRASISVYAATFVLAASVAVSAATPATSAVPAAKAQQLAGISIDNFGAVNDNYYRGAQPAGHDYADLAALGVKTVIDFTADGEAEAGEAAMVQAAGMKFYRIPMTTHDEPAASAITKFLGLVNDSANQPVYVHCQGGRHRTGVMTAVYRMTHDGWTSDRAFAEMQQYKFGAAFLHATLKDFVYSYKVPTQVASVVSAKPAAAEKPTVATAALGQ